MKQFEAIKENRHLLTKDEIVHNIDQLKEIVNFLNIELEAENLISNEGTTSDGQSSEIADIDNDCEWSCNCPGTPSGWCGICCPFMD